MEAKELALLQPYCDNDMKLLKKMSRSIFMKFNEPLTNVDHDDFYSVANMALWQAYNAYRPELGISFDAFLRSCLEKKFKSELTNRHRHKRVISQFTTSFDVVRDGGEECSLLELIPSDFDTFEEATRGQENSQYRDKIQQYISKLSKMQVNILNLLVDGYKAYEIRQILEISPTEYADNLSTIRSYENVKILF